MSFDLQIISSKNKNTPKTLQINYLSLEEVIAFLYQSDENYGRRLTTGDVKNFIQKYKNNSPIFIESMVNNVDNEERMMGLTLEGIWDKENFTVQRITIDHEKLTCGKVSRDGRFPKFEKNVDVEGVIEDLCNWDVIYFDQQSDAESDGVEEVEAPKNLQNASAATNKNVPSASEPAVEKPNENAGQEEKNVPKEGSSPKPNPNPDGKKEDTLAKSLQDKLKQKNENSGFIFKVPSLLAAATFLGRWLILGLSTTFALVGAAATFVVTGIINIARHHLKRRGYKEVFQDDNVDLEGSISKLSEEDFEVFKHGAKAKNEILSQFKSCFRPEDWANADKYYAGYAFQQKFPEVNEEDLNKIRKPQAK